jgi:hypothetical protein
VEFCLIRCFSDTNGIEKGCSDFIRETVNEIPGFILYYCIKQLNFEMDCSGFKFHLMNI